MKDEMISLIEDVSFDSKTGKIESPPSVIVALNGYSEFIKELLNKLN